MSFAPVSRSTWNLYQSSALSAGRAAIAAVLCVLMVDQPLLAATTTRRGPTAGSAAQLQGQERVVHALNRLTFGPKPGEVAEVEKIGLKVWFERQLNPSSIDDSALEAKLAAFPAMQMTQSELMRRYPGPQMLKQIIDGHAQLPSDPTERALYQDQIAFYKKATKANLLTPMVLPKAAGNDVAGVPLGQMPQAKPSSMDSTPMGDGGGAADNSMTVPSAPVAPARKPANRRVDLLGDNMGNVVGKKNDKAGGDAMAIEAGKAANGDPAPDDMNLAGRGRRQHDERFFPEAKTAEILALTPNARLQAVLALPPDQLSDFRRSLSQAEIVAFGQGFNPLQREQLASLQGSTRLVGGELEQSRMLRDIYSGRQLEAVMTDFWLNHFNVYIRKNQQEPYLLPAYERDTIRPNALGNFESLLVATAESPAMMMYLDNFQSIGPDSLAVRRGPQLAQRAQNPQVQQALKGLKDRGLNENYARELMELHTVGVQCEVSKDRPASMLPPSCGAGYTQADVTNVAKVLTGWTIDRPYQGGEFRFDDRRHEPGDKQVLGVTIHDGGQQEGLQLLHMLATSPATAHFISYKLAVRFVSDTPPDALVDRMAKSFLASNGDIKTVLRTMFNSPEFWSPKVYRAKVKTPEEFVISAVRASGAQVQNSLPLVQALNQLGMGFYQMQTPNGYSWMSEPWVSTGALVSRMNFALVLSGNRLAGTRVDWDAVLGEGNGYKPVDMTTSGVASEAVAKKERTLEQILMGEPVSAKTKATVLAQADNVGATDQAAKSFAAQGSPDAMTVADAPVTGSFLTGDLNRNRAQQPQDRQAAVIAGLLLGSPEFQRR